MKRNDGKFFVFLVRILGAVTLMVNLAMFSQASTVMAGSDPGDPSPQTIQAGNGHKLFLPQVRRSPNQIVVPEYTLTINKVGNGTVTKSPNQTTYHAGDVVTLTTTADPGWTFGSWSANVVSGKVTINGNTAVTATFIQNEYTLTIQTVGNGSVTRSPDNATYHYGDIVTLTATPDAGWGFGSWSTNVTSGKVTINGNMTVTATFLQNGFTLTINKVGSGTVTKTPDQVTYHLGDSVQLTATPDNGWTFVGWSGDISGAVNPQTVTMSGSKNITATFSNGTLSGYFVATTGNDANPGTESQPWKTIGKAAQTAVAGDTVYVHSGVYSQQVILAKSGTQDKPIRFQAYPGETPVIDGSAVSIPQGSSLLELRGNWIVVSGFEVSYSKALSVELSGQHNVADNIYSHHSIEQGILARGDYSTVQNCRVWRTALNNENGKMSGGGWASALSAARDNVDGKTDYAVLRNNVSWENWGEGVSSFEANGTIIEGNISYDNYAANIYVSDTTNALVQDNLVYMTSPITYMTKGSRVGIEMGDEVHNPSSANNTIINNIAYGNTWNFFWWAGRSGDGLVNVLIANNTFVNSTSNSNVEIDSGSHQGSQFVDNIIVQDGSGTIAELASSSGLTIKNNLWSKKPSGAANGTGDVIGDPKLAKAGSVYAADWYKLLDGSPAIDKALPLPLVTADFAGAPRGAAPDIGAFEK